MDERTRRIGENEALFRTVNERLEELNRGVGELGRGTFEVVCECGTSDCLERLEVDMAEYERMRRDPTRFVVVPGHQLPDTETVVGDGPGYLIVAKDAGDPAALAEATDPR